MILSRIEQGQIDREARNRKTIYSNTNSVQSVETLQSEFLHIDVPTRLPRHQNRGPYLPASLQILLPHGRETYARYFDKAFEESP